MTTTLHCTLNFALSDEEAVCLYVAELCEKLCYVPDNLRIEPYWKIADQLQAKLALDLGRNQAIEQGVGEARAIAAEIAQGDWSAIGPDSDDQVVYELIYDGMGGAAPLQWAHVQVVKGG